MKLTYFGYDWGFGVAYNLDNFYVSLIGGAFFLRTKAEALNTVNLDQPTSPLNGAGNEINVVNHVMPHLRLELGYEWDNFQIGVYWMHAFSIDRAAYQFNNVVTGLAGKDSEVGMDAIFGGIRWLWA